MIVPKLSAVFQSSDNCVNTINILRMVFAKMLLKPWNNDDFYENHRHFLGFKDSFTKIVFECDQFLCFCLRSSPVSLRSHQRHQPICAPLTLCSLCLWQCRHCRYEAVIIVVGVWGHIIVLYLVCLYIVIEWRSKYLGIYVFSWELRKFNDDNEAVN